MSRNALLRRFVRDDKGSYAIEFAIVSLVFLALILGIMQYGLLFMARQSLDMSLQKAVRGLLTGSFQTANTGVSDSATILANLKTLMCATGSGNTIAVFDCSSVMLDVQVVSSFASGSPSASAVDSQTGTWSSGFGTSYTCPKPKSIAVVRAAVKIAPIANPIALKLGTFSDGSILIQSGAAFRVEQYSSGASGGC